MISLRGALVIRFKLWRRNAVAATPDLHLRLTVEGRGLCLVEPLQRSVVALVQPPRLVLGNPHQVHCFEHDPQRLDRTAQHGGEGDVERVSVGGEDPGGLSGFFHALLGQSDIGPASETILAIPETLAVAEEHEFMHDSLLCLGATAARAGPHAMSTRSGQSIEDGAALAEAAPG